jgi:hypothetical protein
MGEFSPLRCRDVFGAKDSPSQFPRPKWQERLEEKTCFGVDIDPWHRIFPLFSRECD